MKNFLTLFKPKENQNAVKERILKNREAVLDIMGKNIKDARQCPLLLGEKCIGQFCEFFLQFCSENKNGEKKEFWRCVHIQNSLLLIELNDNIRALIKLIAEEKK